MPRNGQTGAPKRVSLLQFSLSPGHAREMDEAMSCGSDVAHLSIEPARVLVICHRTFKVSLELSGAPQVDRVNRHAPLVICRLHEGKTLCEARDCLLTVTVVEVNGTQRVKGVGGRERFLAG